MKRKLIEVGLPLEAINKASARESSTRGGQQQKVNYDFAELLARAQAPR